MKLDVKIFISLNLASDQLISWQYRGHLESKYCRERWHFPWINRNPQNLAPTLPILQMKKAILLTRSQFSANFVHKLLPGYWKPNEALNEVFTF